MVTEGIAEARTPDEVEEGELVETGLASRADEVTCAGAKLAPNARMGRRLGIMVLRGERRGSGSSDDGRLGKVR